MGVLTSTKPVVSGAQPLQWSANRMQLGKLRNSHHVARRSGVGPRLVLIPGTRTCAPHPWRDRLRKAVAR
jgi:hypothetical protein